MSICAATATTARWSACPATVTPSWIGFPCPTIVASGPPITSPGGHCWHMGGEATGPDQLRQAVRERAERHVDVVKVMASGGNTTPDTDVMACQFTLEELRVWW